MLFLVIKDIFDSSLPCTSLPLLGDMSPDIACGSHIDLDSAESVALPVSVSEIIKRVPLDCGKCHPEIYLKGKYRQTFLHQEHLVVSEEPLAAALPKPCYRVEESEEEKLRELRRGFSCLIPESQVATTHEGRLILNGMFQVEDRPGKHRLMFDKRPSNICERSLPWLELPIRSFILPYQISRGRGVTMFRFRSGFLF